MLMESNVTGRASGGNLSPSVGDAKILSWKLAEVAQLVEHHLAKVRVAGSNPVFRSRSEGVSGNRSPFLVPTI